MAYPGNLHTLVSRDRQAKSHTDFLFDTLKSDSCGANTRRAMPNPPKRSTARSRAKQRPKESTHISTAEGIGVSQLLSDRSLPQPFRATGLRFEDLTCCGAKAWRILPSEYGKRMDTQSLSEPPDCRLNAAHVRMKLRKREFLFEQKLNTP